MSSKTCSAHQTNRIERFGQRKEQDTHPTPPHPYHSHPPVYVVLEVVLEVPGSRQHQRHGLDGGGRQSQQTRNLYARDVQGLGRENRQAA